MTTTSQPDTSATDGDDIVPPDVSALIDDAYAAGHNILLTPTSLQMVGQDGGLLREAFWTGAGAWAKRVLEGAMAAAGSERLSTAPNA